MSQELLLNLIKQSDELTSEELSQLVNYLAVKVQSSGLANEPRRKLSAFKGRAPYPLVGEDAQAWVSHTRQEATEERDELLGQHDKG
jgi:hypothetical protein